MARFSFAEEHSDADRFHKFTAIGQVMVRAFGFILMLVGLWIGLAVLLEAWGLYREPTHIERFARAIEKGSNLDRALANTRPQRELEQQSLVERKSTPRAATRRDDVSFRLSYFAAWVVAILLLLLVGRLAIAAIKTGGELMLYDVQVKRFARELARLSNGNIPR